MILLLDIGNTRLKSATWDGVLREGAALVHNDQPLQLFSEQSWPTVSSVWISLVPRLSDVAGWTVAVQRCCNVMPQFAHAATRWQGLRSAYAKPENLGVDRWLGMVALWHERPSSFCVVSAGTALTFDRVNAQGQHLGGIIAPGLSTTRERLLKVTQRSADTHDDPDSQQLGCDSASAIRQGAFFSALGAVDHALRAPGVDVAERRVICGGDAAELQPHLQGGPWQHRPRLVLEGLLALALAQNSA
jgi:type III pantothenate kinase